MHSVFVVAGEMGRHKEERSIHYSGPGVQYVWFTAYSKLNSQLNSETISLSTSVNFYHIRTRLHGNISITSYIAYTDVISVAASHVSIITHQNKSCLPAYFKNAW